MENPSVTLRTLERDLNVPETTIRRHLHKLGFNSKRVRVIPHDLTAAQATRRVNICEQLLENPNDQDFWRRIVTGRPPTAY